MVYGIWAVMLSYMGRMDLDEGCDKERETRESTDRS